MLVAGAVFAIFAALFYWFPKMTGRKLNERLGKIQFWLLFIGTNVAFFPQHLLGLDGMIRRIADYSAERRLDGAQLPVHASAPSSIALSILPFMWNVFTRSAARGRRERSVGCLHAGVGDHAARRRSTTSTTLPPVRSERPALRPQAPRAGHAAGPRRVQRARTTTGHVA